MSAVTIAQLRQSVRALIASYPGIGTDVSTGGALLLLPAYEVTAGSATRLLSGRRFLVRRALRVWVYAAEVANVNDEAEVRADYVTAEALLDPLADFLADNPTLKLNGVPLVTGMTPAADNGVGLLHYEQRIYAGFSLEFSVDVGR